MRDEHDLEARPQGGLIFWVPLTAGRRVAWLRASALFLLLPVLASIPGAFGDTHLPGAPLETLATASLAVILIRVWTTLVDLIYRLDSRERRYVMSYLIALGLTIVLAVVVRFTAQILDSFLSPGGHFFALQGVFAVLLTLLVAPITLSIQHHEPPSYYLQRLLLDEDHWDRIEQPMRHIFDHHPQGLRPALLLLESLLHQGDYDEARALLKHLTTWHSQAWGGWAAMGTLALEHEQWDRAITTLREACRLAPRSAQGGLHLNLGLALLGAGNLDEGRAEIEHAKRRALPPHLRHFCRFMLMRIGQVQQDPGLMLINSRAAKRFPRDGQALLDWYETLDRSRSPTFAEDLYEAADWTRHLLNIRQVI